MERRNYNVVDKDRFNELVLDSIDVNHTVQGIEAEENDRHSYKVKLVPHEEIPQEYVVSKNLIESMEENGVIERKSDTDRFESVSR